MIDYIRGVMMDSKHRNEIFKPIHPLTSESKLRIFPIQADHIKAYEDANIERNTLILKEQQLAVKSAEAVPATASNVQLKTSPDAHRETKEHSLPNNNRSV